MKHVFFLISAVTVLFCSACASTATAGKEAEPEPVAVKPQGSAPIIYEVAFTELDKGIFEDENHLTELHADKQYVFWLAYNDPDMDTAACRIDFESPVLKIESQLHPIQQRRNFPTAIGFSIDFPAVLAASSVKVTATVVDESGNESLPKSITANIIR